MPSLLVTCPDSSKLELIDFEDDDLGMLVTACTAFKPACELGCGRMCAARLDHHRRLAGAQLVRGARTDTP
jgi:hypothetical protein